MYNVYILHMLCCVTLPFCCVVVVVAFPFSASLGVIVHVSLSLTCFRAKVVLVLWWTQLCSSVSSVTIHSCLKTSRKHCVSTLVSTPLTWLGQCTTYSYTHTHNCLYAVFQWSMYMNVKLRYQAKALLVNGASRTAGAGFPYICMYQMMHFGPGLWAGPALRASVTGLASSARHNA